MTRLLIVDDNMRMTKSFSGALKSDLDLILTANTVKEAITMIDRVDVVMTDWQMPDGGGGAVLDACEKINKPVFVFSGLWDATKRAPVLQKDCGCEAILDMIKELTD